jgi:AraC-like DNA-binding protein
MAQNDSALDVIFECGQAGVKRSEFPGLSHLRLEALSVSVPRSAFGTIGALAGTNVVGINLEGAIIARGNSISKIVIVPARSMFFIRGPIRLQALVAKGDHKLQMISWHAESIPFLDAWCQARVNNSRGHNRQVGCKPISPDFEQALHRFEEAKSAQSELTEPLLLSVVHECAGRILVGDDRMQLTPLPAEFPEVLLKLAEAVRANPTGSWSLKEASDMASYSPFHFSRVFKQLVGYGFHEYVDRCRTELAVQMLVTTENPVDLVASQAGFGTTQGLRESVREYLGLVPSEFRSLPDPMD